jgi:NDP-mannose synthase
MTHVHAIIQAGGLGQRIRPAAGSIPKPLLAIGGTPMIERLLCQVTAAGIRRITVVLGSQGESVRAHVLRTARSLPDDVHLDFFVENSGLGNAGALGLIDTGNDTALLCFADLVTDLSFATLCAIHAQRGCNVTLTSHYEYHQLSLGELVVEGDAVQGYSEKPRKRFLICSGIALFDANAMAVARRMPRPFGISDLVSTSLREGCSVTHWLHEAYWIDVNTPELLTRAREDNAARKARAS